VGRGTEGVGVDRVELVGGGKGLGVGWWGGGGGVWVKGLRCLGCVEEECGGSNSTH